MLGLGQQLSQLTHCHELAVGDLADAIKQPKDGFFGNWAMQVFVALGVHIGLLLHAHVFSQLLQVALNRPVHRLFRASLQKVYELHWGKDVQIGSNILLSHRL